MKKLKMNEKLNACSIVYVRELIQSHIVHVMYKLSPDRAEDFDRTNTLIGTAALRRYRR